MPQNIDHDGEELRPDELDALSREIQPSDALEERVVIALRHEGLIRSGSAEARHGRAGRSPLGRAAMAASLLLVSALGFAGGRMMAPEPARGDYMLILRTGATQTATLPQDEELRRFNEYSRWYRAALARGEMVAGEKLRDDASVLLTGGPPGGAQVGRGPASTIEGFFLINASSDEEAERIASECPHIRYGGAIEVRKIDKLDEGDS